MIQVGALATLPIDDGFTERLGTFEENIVPERYRIGEAESDAFHVEREMDSSTKADELRKENIIPTLPSLQKEADNKGIALQKWEGVVLGRNGDTFLARLYDKTADSPEEEAELLISDVADDDLPLLRPGAIFYLNIGYIVKSSGQKIRGPIIIFRRMPVWTRKELAEIDKRVRERMTSLGWGTDEATEGDAASTG